jgi:uncharacterized Zn finger protein (UPF0148 family)
MNCPSCGTKIDADFGMISCPMCSTVFMVEMDGTIQELKEESVSDSVEEISSFNSEPTNEGSNDFTSMEEPPMEPAGSFEMSEAPEENGASEENPLEEMPQAYLNQEPEMPSEGEMAMDVEGVESDLEASMESDLQSEVAPVEEENVYSENFIDDFNNPQADELDPLGVVAFDESAASNTTEGIYYYDLKIMGLDSGQIRKSVMDALNDPRFDWVGDEIKNKISGGELLLENLNPVKAVLAVIRLQPLDVDITWEQKLYTDESLQEPQQEGEV